MIEPFVAAEPTLPCRVAVAWPTAAWRDVHVLVAASGGPDSIALLRVLMELKRDADGAGRIAVGHVNHQLRGGESVADEGWLVDECRRLGVECLIRRDETAAAAREQGDGIEAAARKARYRLLTELAEEVGARFVAVGHTRDDQAETVLFRILRGTGLRGLAGAPRLRPLSPAVTLVRPLLDVRRTEVERYLASIGQDARCDATNADRGYARNRIRHDVLPKLSEEFGCDASEALARLANQAGEAQRIIESAATALLGRCDVRMTNVADGDRTLSLRTNPLSGEPEELVCEAVRIAWRNSGFGEQAMTRSSWLDLAALALAERDSPLNLPGGVTARRDDGRLTLEWA